MKTGFFFALSRVRNVKLTHIISYISVQYTTAWQGCYHSFHMQSNWPIIDNLHKEVLKVQ